MRIQLPDVNILLAMYDPSHPHNETALRWFDSEGRHCWATCPLTENGFVRIYTQKHFANQLDGVRESFFILNTMKQTYRATHHFWNDDISLSDADLLTPAKIAGPKQITDVYLIGLCQKHGGTLITFDTRLSTDAIVSPHTELLHVLPTP